MKNGIPQITVKELKRRIDAGEDVFSSSTCASPTNTRSRRSAESLFPRTMCPQRLAEIDRDREIVVHCRSGARTQRIAEFLQQSGYPKVANLAGGILAWSDEIDPKVQKY